MDNYRQIKRKLHAFISKYYRIKLLKGLILFVVTGLVYFLLILSVEHFLWLNTTGRSILFLLFIAVEVFFLVVFLLVPVLKLLRLSKGLNEEEASLIIGEHFPEVKDKLLNLLQLHKNQKQTDLLLAGIDQKSKELNPVPFDLAVNFRSVLKYLKWAAFPLIIILALVFTGNSSAFTDSYGRIVDYKTVYEPPAPFYFNILNKELSVLENRSFKLQVKPVGEIIPEDIAVEYNGQSFILKKTPGGNFEYEFKRLKEDLNFRLVSNGVSSREYTIEVVKVPALLDLQLHLEYPGYTLKQNEVISGTGNARVPEGTKINWRIETRQTTKLNFTTKDSSQAFSSVTSVYNFEFPVYSSLDYTLSTSNENINEFEAVEYAIEVEKDEYPEIKIETKKDSIDESTVYYYGQVSDDYALSRLRLVYYPEGNKDSVNIEGLPVQKESFDEFHYTFPGDLPLKRGRNYHYYFEVFDNDGENGAKSSRSDIFGYRKKTLDEVEQEKLEQQGESIENLNESLEEMEDSGQELQEISRMQKENRNLNYNEKKKIEEFLERQKLQNEMMKNYSEELKESLEEENENSEENSDREELKERLENTEKRLEENEALMEELKEFTDKINREELGDKLEELSKRNQTQKRDVEQLLELTKRYYVEEKKQKLARDLQKLAEKQEELSGDEENNTKENQEKLSEEFEDFREDLDELEKDNERLKEPSELGREKIDEESIEKDQKDAEEELKGENQEKAKQKQQDASKKMKEMSAMMQQQMMAQSGEELEADIETLRQILANLVRFSFDQEYLLEEFKNMNREHPMFAERLRYQSDLRENFRHIDDSLYTLALKNPMLNEEITSKLTDIEFDMEKALERLAENELPQGISSQQYVITGANDLAYLLSNILSSMQQQANPQLGKGQGEQEFQLPDIIEKQEQLQEQLQEGMKENQEGEGEEESEQEGSSGEEQENGELFEIYKQQQEIRQELEQLLEKEGKSGEGENLEENMKRLEEQLLDKGFEPGSLEQMTNLIHELLKFENARLQQGEDSKRESQTNTNDFSNRAKDQNLKAKEYFNSTEILNRQILPLRGIYKQKVKVYFGKED